MIRLHPDDLPALMEATQSQDVFGLHALASANGVETADVAFFEAADDLLSGLIEGHGHTPDYRDGLRDVLRHRTVIPINRLTAEILAHEGMDPATLVAITTMLACDGYFQHSADDTTAAVIDDEYDADADDSPTRVELAEGVRWYAAGAIGIRGMPETTLAAAVGRPLRDVISHPSLDRHPLRVAGICSRSGVERLLVGPEYDRSTLDLDGLMGIRRSI